MASTGRKRVSYGVAQLPSPGVGVSRYAPVTPLQFVSKYRIAVFVAFFFAFLFDWRIALYLFGYLVPYRR